MGPLKHIGPISPREGNNEAKQKKTRRQGEFVLMSRRRWMRSRSVKPCIESLAPSYSHVDRAEVVLPMSLKLMETGPARHQDIFNFPS